MIHQKTKMIRKNRSRGTTEEDKDFENWNWKKTEKSKTIEQRKPMNSQVIRLQLCCNKPAIRSIVALVRTVLEKCLIVLNSNNDLVANNSLTAIPIKKILC